MPRRIRSWGCSILIVMAAASDTGAQAARLTNGGAPSIISLLARPARLQIGDTTLVAALVQLEQRSGVALAYSPSLLPQEVRVRCDCAELTMREALSRLLDGTIFGFAETEGQVLLAPRARVPGDAALNVRSAGAGGDVMLSVASTPSEATRAELFVILEPATITGRVTSEGGAPVSSALVALRSLQLSGVTNDAGEFRLVVPEARVVARTDTLRVTRLGFRPVNVPFTMRQGEIRIDVVMASQVVALEQVLVTGTAGNQERRAQAAVIASIDASDIVAKAPVINVNELLTARAAGVSLTTASGTAGANTRINIRGQASLSLSNYPLVFVDGVRVTAGPRAVAQVPGGVTAGAGGQQFNALNDINPADIESIEIVKGPAAATLYGSDASAGVIQILTKRGRVGARQFSQTLTLSFDRIEPNFTPYTNYARCTAALVAANSPNPLCREQEVGTIVSDNVLTRNDVFNSGWAGTLNYNVRGGGDSFGYFGSFGAENTNGTVPGSFLNHRTGRANFNWTVSPRMSLEAGVGLVRADDHLPQGDQSSYSYTIGGYFGSPLSVRSADDGSLAGGWFMPTESVESISAILTRDVTTRVTPSVRVHYNPVSWFTNRLTLGGDLTRTAATQMYPRNERSWYTPALNQGVVTRNELHNTIYTVDYLGNVSRRFGTGDRFSSDLSFGSQWINSTEDLLSGSGQGLLTNAANVVSAATTTTGSQGYGQSKSLGLLVQEQLGFRDRLFVQLGARVDRNSAFGQDVGSFFLPKAGFSWVVSEEAFWRSSMPWVSTLRLRGAFGTTGRSPSGVAALQTYIRTNYVTETGLVQAGVSPGSPGNPNLKPERGVEVEGGFDAGFFGDRAGLELTYFNKQSKDLLLSQPLAPSSGFATNPLVNIGEVVNRGLELSMRATPIDRGRITWDAQLNVSTLHNEIVSMGDVTPFISNNQCFKPGYQVAAWCVPRVLVVDTVAGRATVSDTAEMVGGQLPKWEGAFNSTVTLWRNLRLYGQVDGKFGHKVYNLTRDFRDRSLGNSAEAVLPPGEGGYDRRERMRRYGPFVTQSGSAIGAALVRDPYIVEGDFVRFRELAATYALPTSFARQFRMASASISIGAKNLALWTKYDGFDPEVFGVTDPVTPFLGDVFTTPQVRRLFTRLSVQF
jgi:TonB-dependent starch-binding outer membrane protein SusC